jgi:hypothetical protein
VSAVVEIEQYRFEHNITDGRTPIGPEPTDYAKVLEWHRVHESIGDAREVIAPPTRVLRPAPLSIDGLALDISS